jgi:hypothetical protein
MMHLTADDVVPRGVELFCGAMDGGNKKVDK